MSAAKCKKSCRVCCWWKMLRYDNNAPGATPKSRLPSSTVCRRPMLGFYLCHYRILVFCFADLYRRKIRSLQLRRGPVDNVRKSCWPNKCLHRTTRSNIHQKISWEGLGAQTVGAVLTNTSFFAYFYGGMKTFSSFGYTTRLITYLREFGDQSMFSGNLPAHLWAWFNTFAHMRGTNSLTLKVARLGRLMLAYQGRKGWR